MSGKDVIVTTPNHTADVQVVKEHDVIVKPRNFVLTSASCANMLDGTVVPDWLSDSIAGMVASGVNGTQNLIQALDDFVRQLDTGVHQQINAVQTESLSNYQLITQNVAELGNDVAGIVEILDTKVNSTEASSLFTTLLTSQFNTPSSDANAWIVSQTETLANAVTANANSLSLLTADYNGLAISVQTLDQAQAGMFSEWDGVTAPALGQFKLVGDVYYQYLGGTFGENSDGWVQTDKSAADIAAQAETYAAGASKFVLDPNGNITGWEFADGSGTQSVFKVHADQFQVANSQTGLIPFSITNNNIVFNGLVTFGNNQIGTIDEAVSAVVETVSVGDKNINITDNLIPTTSLVADTDNSGYQFIGTPTKSLVAGIDSFAEAQIVLDIGDEVYSPYVDEVTLAYYYRFGVKGVTDLTSFKIVTVNDNILDVTDTATYHTVTVTLEPDMVINAAEWYIVEGIINPFGGNTDPSGVIRDMNGRKIATIDNFAMPSDAKVMLLGWYANSTISRMKLAKISADTITGSYVTPDGVADAINNNTTTIDGSRITTGTINADKINVTGLIAENIYGDTISGKTISGGYINGAVIEGAIIRGSFLDLSSTSYLTNWQSVTDINTIPAEFRGNFAKHDDGSYIIDAQGYYRLPTARTIAIAPYSYLNNVRYDDLNTHYETISFDVPLFPYDAYQAQTASRILDHNSTLLISNIKHNYRVSHYANQRTKQYLKFKCLGKVYEMYTDTTGATTMNDFNMQFHAVWLKEDGVAITPTKQLVFGDMTIYLNVSAYQALYTFGLAIFTVTVSFPAEAGANKTLNGFSGAGQIFEFIEYWSKNDSLKNGYGATIQLDQDLPEILMDNGG